MSLYKQVPLRELARRFQTNPRRLRRAAQRSGLEDEPAVIAENEARLGTVPDPTLAEQLGVTPEIVKGARMRRGLAAYDPRAPKPKTSRKSSRKAPAPKAPAKPPRVRPDPTLVEVFRRGSSPPSAPAAAPPVVERAPLRPPRVAEPARPPEAERRWRTEDRSWGEPRPTEAEAPRRRLPRVDETGERRRIVQSSPRSGESTIRRVPEGSRTAREPSPPRRDNDDFEDYASRRIRESGRRLAETMEELEPDVQPRIAPDSARPRRRIVATERPDAPERPAAPEPEPVPQKRKRTKSVAPPVRTLFVREQDGELPAELLRDLPVFPEPVHAPQPAPALIPPHIPVPPPVAPVVTAPVVTAPLRFWQAILGDGGLLIVAAADLAAAARLLAGRGPITRLEPAALLA